MCSIMGYCGSGATFDSLRKVLTVQYHADQTTVELLIQVKVFLVFTGLLLWV